MLKTIIERLREPLPNPVNIADGISLIHRANRERKAAALELEKLQKIYDEAAAPEQRSQIDNN